MAKLETGRTAIARRLAVTGFCLVVWRVLAFVPIPFVTPSFLQHIRAGAPGSPLVAGLTGSAIEPYSVVAMGLNPFAIAFVLFWLSRVTPGGHRAWIDEKSRWRVLAIGTVFAALFEGESLTRYLFSDHPQDVLAATGLAATAALIAGTMMLFGLGKVIERFGLPPRNGVWFLFAVLSLRKGVHMLGAYVQGHASSDQLVLHLFAYAVATLFLTFAVLAIVRARRRVPTEEGPGLNQVHQIDLSLTIGGLVVPLLSANAVMLLPDIAAHLIGSQATSWMDQYFRPDGPLIWLAVVYNLGYAAAIVGASVFAMLFNFDAGWMARQLTKSGSRLRGMKDAAGAERALGAIALRTTLIGSIAVCGLVVLAPLTFRLVTGMQHPGLTAGGSAFVIAGTLLVDAIASTEQSLIETRAQDTAP
jgi:preprotein translocase subunit SecY